MKIVLILLLSVIFITACSKQSITETHTTANPTAEEIFEMDNDPDIFQFNDLIYSYVEWAQEEGLEKGEPVGEITKTTSASDEFTTETANKLPVGTKIYQTTEGGWYNLVVELDGEEVVYIALVEG